MNEKVKISERTKPWEYRFEDDEAIRIWKYDNKKNSSGPYSVEIRYKKPPTVKSVKRSKVKLRR